MEAECPRCGGCDVIPETRPVSFLQAWAAILSFGLYDPWTLALRESTTEFWLGQTSATCEICGHTFTATEEVDRERLILNYEIRLTGQKRLGRDLERHKYPRSVRCQW